MGKKVVIFDFDGTLADSLWAWNKVDEIYFGKRGIDYCDDVINFSGMSLTEAATYVKNKYKVEESIEEIKKEWEEIGKNLYINEVKPKAFAKECVLFAKEKGCKVAIGSSNGQNSIRSFLVSNDMLDDINYIITSCEVGKGKPNPDIFLNISDYFGVLPGDCVVFEDTIEGVSAAKNAGMKAIAVEEKRNEKTKKQIIDKCDEYILSFDEIIKRGYF